MAERAFISRRFSQLEDVEGNPVILTGPGSKEKAAPVTALAPEVSLVRDQVRGKAHPLESADADPRLAVFQADYEKDATLKGKILWVEIRNRLLANNGRYLALALAMEQGGELFGVDAEGNPLICDRGDEPIMKGMNYQNTRARVLYQHAHGQMIVDKGGQPALRTGYEMFPMPPYYSSDYDKSPEVLQYEAHTGKPFVKDPNEREWRSSWLESGETRSWIRVVDFSPSKGGAGGDVDSPGNAHPSRGVRRLLRVRNA